LREVHLLLADIALEISPSLELQGGYVVGAGGAKAVEFRFAHRRIHVGGGSAHEGGGVGGILVIGNRRVADVGSVRLVGLGVVDLLFAREALEVRPSLELQGRDVVGARRAAAVEFGLALGGIHVRCGRTHERGWIGGILVIVELGVSDGRAVGAVVLKVIRLLLARSPEEIGPGLELEARDIVGSGSSLPVELGLTHCRVGARDVGANDGCCVHRVFVVVDLRTAHVGAVRLVVLEEVRLLFTDEALHVGPGLELHRGGDRVGAGRALAPRLGLAERGVRIGGGGAD